MFINYTLATRKVVTAPSVALPMLLTSPTSLRASFEKHCTDLKELRGFLQPRPLEDYIGAFIIILQNFVIVDASVLNSIELFSFFGNYCDFLSHSPLLQRCWN